MVTVRFFAAARAAAGVGEARLTAETLDELVAVLVAEHGVRLGKVLDMASFLVDGLAWHDRQEEFPAGATVDVLPPFAGG